MVEAKETADSELQCQLKWNHNENLQYLSAFNPKKIKMAKCDVDRETFWKVTKKIKSNEELFFFVKNLFQWETEPWPINPKAVGEPTELR